MIKKILKWVGIICLTLIILSAGSIAAVKTVMHFKTRITQPEGIEENCWITLGGISQFVRIRGENTANPVVIFLHGGPGSPTGYLSYTYQPFLEDEYTILYWDQRGSGRTFFENEKDFTPESLSIDRLMDDLDELVQYTKERFKKDSVIIVGHSWGTVIGLKYAKEHTENVSAFVGIGQVVQGTLGDVRAAEEAARRADEAASVPGISQKNAEKHRATAVDIRACSKIFSNMLHMKDVNIDNYIKMRTLSAPYLCGSREKKMSTLLFEGLVSPDMSFTDVRWYIKTLDLMAHFDMELNLLQYSFLDFNAYTSCGTEFAVPLYFISGACDWVTPAVMVKEYAHSIYAPAVLYEEIADTGHSVYFDDPEAFASLFKKLVHSSNRNVEK